MKFIFKSSFLSALMLLASVAFAADATSLLKPPPGARVAIVVFEDLECPSCAHAYPQVWQIANENKIPVVLKDYTIPTHHWSLDAAVFARFFDERSEKLGNDFRGYIYSNQTQITKANLRQWVDKFANDNKVPIPFAVDADGSLKAKVMADRSLGEQLGITGTPTIYVVGSGGSATPAVQTPIENLSQRVQEMLAKAPAPVKTPAKAGTTRKKVAKKTQ